MPEKPELLETYAANQWSVYALWGVTIPGDVYVEIAAVIGAPAHLEATAEAAGTCRGVATAWLQDSSDWEGLTGATRDEALAVLVEHAPELAEEHLPAEWAENGEE